MTTGRPARPGTATLDAVAERAGVSRATVSRVVNGSARVSPQVRAAVEAAVAELRYVPNRVARSLVTRRTDTVAMVLSEREARLFSDPFFARVVRGLTSALADSELHLVLLTAHGQREQEKVARYVRQGHVDGVVLVSQHRDDALPGLLDDSGVPLVLAGRPLDGRAVSYVDADNAGGGGLATAHLLGLGRRRVATVTGPLDMVAGRDRLQGYREALRQAGVAADPSLEAEGDFTREGAERATAALLARAPDLDALFVASDLMAEGALRALAAHGSRVPDDVAVVGFDDAPLARSTAPPLTTVAQPVEQMTGLLLELLLEQVQGAGTGPRSRLCPTWLVRRASA